MLAVQCNRHCRNKSNIAEQNLQNFYNSCAVLLILCTLANSAQKFCARLESQHSNIPTFDQCLVGSFMFHTVVQRGFQKWQEILYLLCS